MNRKTQIYHINKTSHYSHEKTFKNKTASVV